MYEIDVQTTGSFLLLLPLITLDRVVHPFELFYTRKLRYLSRTHTVEPRFVRHGIRGKQLFIFIILILVLGIFKADEFCTVDK